MRTERHPEGLGQEMIRHVGHAGEQAAVAGEQALPLLRIPGSGPQRAQVQVVEGAIGSQLGKQARLAGDNLARGRDLEREPARSRAQPVLSLADPFHREQQALDLRPELRSAVLQTVPRGTHHRLRAVSGRPLEPFRQVFRQERLAAPDRLGGHARGVSLIEQGQNFLGGQHVVQPELVHPKIAEPTPAIAPGRGLVKEDHRPRPS